MDENRKEHNEMWKKKWEDGHSRWHLGKVNTCLMESFPRLDDGHLKGKRILVPLCGKTEDMRWFYEKGMSVVGIDVAEQAVKEFFTENNFDYKVETSTSLPDCHVYRHNERMSIVLCDLFQVNVEAVGGKFDYFWDRAALVAMVPEEHQKYWALINSLMSDQSQGLLETHEYDSSRRPGPPHSIHFEELSKILGDTFTAEEVLRKPEDELPEDEPRIGYGDVRVYYHLRRKGQ